MFEEGKQEWAGEMKSLLIEMKQAVDAARDAGRSEMHVLRVCAFEGRYRKLRIAGHKAKPPPVSHGKRGRNRQGTARNLLLRLEEHPSSVLAFLSDFRVPFDNNLAERDLRMMKVKQKVSGGFRSQTGADAFNRIRGYISTLRKQGHSVLSALQSVFSGQPLMPDLSP